ncbi:cytochrome P450 [Pseudomonas nabeulensis]|uniref:Cytochrome P450 n=1 Tax=Pseudomonas nabeulensis TaxID=2293833 RepID=A0A4Z0B6G2_9PSED|nr:cytochrome P450 [Pseudomonas nabeulensis]TFY94157.1 cytochrome P450 [Pseudomonas nabeulensis]
MPVAVIADPRVTVAGIPNLDAPPAYQPASLAANGLSRILLPSGHLAYHLTRYEHVQALLLDNRAKRGPCNQEGGASFLPTISPPELLLNSDFPEHGRLRKVVARDFSPSGVEALRNKTKQVIHQRLDALQRQGDGADLFTQVLDHIPSIVSCHLLGVPLGDRAYFRPLGHAVQVASSADVPELLNQFWGIYDYLTDLVTGARPTCQDGMIQRLVAARADSEPPLTDQELVGVLLGVLIGGDQNALSGLSKVVYTLLAAPPLWQQLVDDPGLIPNAVEELLRLIPLGTISIFPRSASADLEGPWGLIPEGSSIYADAFAANRDPAVFSDPLTIRLDRNEARHLQFGYGLHNCMGAALARMEITTVVQILVQRFPNLRLAVPADQVPWVNGIILRRPSGLPVHDFTSS